MSDFAMKLDTEREKIREMVADNTLHWWRQQGVIHLQNDYYKAKEKLMDYLREIGI